MRAKKAYEWRMTWEDCLPAEQAWVAASYSAACSASIWAIYARALTGSNRHRS